MTKVQALTKLLEDKGGVAAWNTIYDEIEKYYPSAKASREWKAGLRGVVYREMYARKNFKRVGLGLVGLLDFREQKKEEIEKDHVRMHSYIEGVCIELGNFDNYLTFTADPSAQFQKNVFLKDLTTLKELPEFSYPEILRTTKRIDVLWFNNSGFLFPQRAFEIVDSIGTLGEALNRTYQLFAFKVDFVIVGQEANRNKFEEKVNREPYKRAAERYNYRSYDEVLRLYQNKLEYNQLTF